MTFLPMAAFAAKEGYSDGHQEAKAGLPQLDLTTWPSQIFWLGIAFTILYSVFSSKILPAISMNIQNRENTIQNDLRMAEKLTADAMTFQSQYDERLENSRQESMQMSADLDAWIRKTQEEKQAAFQKTVEARTSETKAQIAKMSKKYTKDIEIHIEETALIAAQNIAGIKTDAKAVKLSLIHI